MRRAPQFRHSCRTSGHCRAPSGVFLSFAISSVVGGGLTCAADPSSLASASLHGLEGHRIKLKRLRVGSTVLVFYSTECPISNSYSPTLKTLVESFPAEKVKWIGVCVDPDLSDADVKAHARDFSLKFPVARDKRGSAGAESRREDDARGISSSTLKDACAITAGSTTSLPSDGSGTPIPRQTT